MNEAHRQPRCRLRVRFEFDRRLTVAQGTGNSRTQLPFGVPNAAASQYPRLILGHLLTDVTRQAVRQSSVVRVETTQTGCIRSTSHVMA